MGPANQTKAKHFKLGQFICLIFVLFSLYLMGDAFYRWDGFSYYAPFSEFLPFVALALILWSIVIGSCRVHAHGYCSGYLKVMQSDQGLKIGIEHLLLCSGIFILSGAVVWKIKKLIWPYLQTTVQIKLAVFFLVSRISLFTAWLFRDRAKRWTGIVNERIIPLVWIFGICLVLAVPISSISYMV